MRSAYTTSRSTGNRCSLEVKVRLSHGCCCRERQRRTWSKSWLPSNSRSQHRRLKRLIVRYLLLKSPFIEVRLGLQQFKLAAMEEGKLSNYVPVTMDELMSRFVINLHRKEYNDAFEQSRKVLEKRDIRKIDNKAIAGSVD